MKFAIEIERDAHDDNRYRVMRASGVKGLPGKPGYRIPGEPDYPEIEAEFWDAESLILYVSAKIRNVS